MPTTAETCAVMREKCKQNAYGTIPGTVSNDVCHTLDSDITSADQPQFFQCTMDYAGRLNLLDLAEFKGNFLTLSLSPNETGKFVLRTRLREMRYPPGSLPIYTTWCGPFLPSFDCELRDCVGGEDQSGALLFKCDFFCKGCEGSFFWPEYHLFPNISGYSCAASFIKQYHTVEISFDNWKTNSSDLGEMLHGRFVLDLGSQRQVQPITCHASRCHGITDSSRSIKDKAPTPIAITPTQKAVGSLLPIIIVPLLVYLIAAVLARRGTSKASKGKTSTPEVDGKKSQEVSGNEGGNPAGEDAEAASLETQGYGLAWLDLRYDLEASCNPWAPPPRRVIDKINGVVLPGEVAAILGPSGCGKTTLLNIIADRRAGYEGKVTLLGKYKAMHRRDVIGYVQQMDSLLQHQTVKEAILFSARLRIPVGCGQWNQNYVYTRVANLMGQLGIDHIADSLVGHPDTGGISGGERKRVDIGIELVTDCPILLLDEATSGLDSFGVASLMELLQQLAKANSCAILMTIHQVPGRFYNSFDRVVLLSRTGRLVFNGKPKESIQFMASCGHNKAMQVNPAEFVLDMAALADDEALGKILDKYDEGPRKVLCTEIETHIKRFREKAGERKANGIVTSEDRPVRPFPVQFWFLLQRSVVEGLRDVTLFLATIVGTVFVGVFMGQLFRHLNNRIVGIQNRIGFLFFLCIYWTLTSLSSLNIFVGERKLYNREVQAGFYNPLMYYLAKAIHELLTLRFLPPLLFTVCCYESIGLRDDYEAFQTFVIIQVLIHIVATAVCLAVSAMSSSVGQASFITVIICIFCITFGGLLVSNATNTQAAKLNVLSFIYFAYEALVVNEFYGQKYIFDAKYGGATLNVDIDGQTVFDFYAMDHRHLWPNIGALQIYFLIASAIGISLFLLRTPVLNKWCVNGFRKVFRKKPLESNPPNPTDSRAVEMRAIDALP